MERRTFLGRLALAGIGLLSGLALLECGSYKPTTPKDSLEQKIAQLFITGSENFRYYIPGGILLSKAQTRERIKRGVWKYDPVKTRENVALILERGVKADRRILIYDEGEGGYVQRIGSLPAAEDIGNYYRNNIIAKSLNGKVIPSEDQQERIKEIEKLFRNYALEISSQGINAVLGPNLDLNPDKKNIMGRDKRSFGDYEEVLAVASLYIQAMHERGIRVTGKHFLAAGLPLGDVHSEEVIQSADRSPKLLSGKIFRKLGSQLDAIMVTHIGNNLDEGRPYSLSRRSLQYLTQEFYTGSRGQIQGINFQGLVIVDDISMKAFTSYAQAMTLRPELENIKNKCRSPECRGVLASLDAGAHTFICLGAQLDPIVTYLAGAYNSDETIKEKMDLALEKYDSFVKNK